MFKFIQERINHKAFMQSKLTKRMFRKLQNMGKVGVNEMRAVDMDKYRYSTVWFCTQGLASFQVSVADTMETQKTVISTTITVYCKDRIARMIHMGRTYNGDVIRDFGFINVVAVRVATVGDVGIATSAKPAAV